jgi:hypothetical protein
VENCFFSCSLRAYIIALLSLGTQNLKYLLSGLFQKKFADCGIDPGGQEMSCMLSGPKGATSVRTCRQEPVRPTKEASEAGSCD